MAELISLREAAQRNIPRLRLPNWNCRMDHITLDVLGNHLGPWGHLYSPMNLALNGRDPFDLLLVTSNIDFDKKEWEVYEGVLPTSEEYKKMQAEFSRTFKEH